MSCTDTKLLSSIRKIFWKRSQGKKKKCFFLINEMAKSGFRAEVEQFCWASCFLQSMGLCKGELCKASAVRFQLRLPSSPIVVSAGWRGGVGRGVHINLQCSKCCWEGLLPSEPLLPTAAESRQREARSRAGHMNGSLWLLALAVRDLALSLCAK